MADMRQVKIVTIALAAACATAEPKQVSQPVPEPSPASASEPPPAAEPTPAPAAETPPPPVSNPQADQAVITDAFARDFDKVQGCYKAQVRKQRGLRGKVTIAFGVDNATHHPIDVRTIPPTTIASAAMLACMVEVVRNVTFAADVTAKERETEFHFEMENQR